MQTTHFYYNTQVFLTIHNRRTSSKHCDNYHHIILILLVFQYLSSHILIYNEANSNQLHNTLFFDFRKQHRQTRTFHECKSWSRWIRWRINLEQDSITMRFNTKTIFSLSDTLLEICVQKEHRHIMSRYSWFRLMFLIEWFNSSQKNPR